MSRASKRQEGVSRFAPALADVLRRQDVQVTLLRSRDDGIRLIHAMIPGAHRRDVLLALEADEAERVGRRLNDYGRQTLGQKEQL